MSSAAPLFESKEEHKTASPVPATKTLTSLTFDNRVLRELPVGRDGQRGTLFSLVPTTPVLNPHVVVLSPPALALLDLPPSLLSSDPSTPLYLSGNTPIPGSQSASHCYCGHQFGAFAGQLGDGAVCYIGEVLNARGERWELQFKGSGLTPYSRSADGRKVLRSSMRELLASEAMAALGIPTTRAASLVTSDTYILRDQFYTGDVKRERASVITRLAPSFIRFGSFEVCKTRDPRTGASGPCVGKVEVLERLMDYVAHSFYADLEGVGSHPPTTREAREARDVAVYREVVERTARMIAAWQCVGWIHGVMNTDNMNILGLTVDYGPYQFMDAYIPSSTSNTSDDQRRYAYDKQRAIGKWNLHKLAEAFSTLWEKDGRREDAMRQFTAVLDATYDTAFDRAYYSRMRAKLGLRGSEAEVRQWVTRFFEVLESTCADFTNSFRILSSVALHRDNSDAVIEYLTEQSAPLQTYAQSVEPLVDPEQLAYYEHVLATNPNVRDSSGLIEGEKRRAAARRAIAHLTDETKRQRDRSLWAAFIAEYRAQAVKEWKVEEEGERRRGMNAVNPKYVLRSDHVAHHSSLPPHLSLVGASRCSLSSASRLCCCACVRNWMAQVAIEKAEAGDYNECQQLLDVLLDPFAVDEDEVVVREGEEKGREVEENKGAGKYTCRPPKDYENVLCSCSS